MKKYTTIDWKKSLIWLIPPLLRKTTHYQWLESLIKPLTSLYELTLYKMQHTGQVIYLEKILNETFNPETEYAPHLSIAEKMERGLIYIDESVKPTAKYIYLHQEYATINIETNPVFLNTEKKPLYLAAKDDYTKIKYANFRVFIPNNLNKSDKINKNSNIQIDKDILNQLVWDVLNVRRGDIEVHTTKYHDLLNYYKLAGKTYETFAYEILAQKAVLDT